jgi:L-ascorbate metabolism protein UlaG (beta-lactamase superfamily)
MQIKRLFWAGLAITVDETTLLVDPLTRYSELVSRKLDVDEPVYTTEPGKAHLAIITHLHGDHYHPPALRTLLRPDGRVVCHQPQAQAVVQDGFTALSVRQKETIELGKFQITAVPAVDGFGDDQVSWIIEAEGKRIIHCGDTLWHGYWWDIQHEYGPFDLAFLPINGAIVARPDLLLQRSYFKPSGLPASLTPEQAVAAGIALGARAVSPIHYGLNTRLYGEFPQAPQLFTEIALRHELRTLWLQPGEEVRWEQI